MDNNLIQALQQFDIRRTEKLGTSESAVFAPGEKGAEMIADTFLPIAKYALYGGHFHVDYKIGDGWAGYDIKFNKIELYYHDEIPGGHIDPIMYHTNLHTPYYLKDRGIKTYPYYAFGAFNLHISGIDVSFENEAKQYRASFLIRDFTVYNAEDGKVISSDPYSTHAFDWFFPNGTSAATMKHLTWIEDIPYEKAKMRSVNQVVRKNVYQYDDQNKKILETQCQKKWQFVRIEE